MKVFKEGYRFYLGGNSEKKSKFVEQCFGTDGDAHMLTDYMEQWKYKENRDIINIIRVIKLLSKLG